MRKSNFLFFLLFFVLAVFGKDCKSSPPVITNIFISEYILEYRKELFLQCDAYDPDGGTIKEYVWEIRDSNDNLVYEFLTMGKECSFMPSMKGGYFKVFVTVVDDEGDSTREFLKSSYSSDWSYLVKYDSFGQFALLPFLKKNMGLKIEKLNTYLINTSDEPVKFKINFFDFDGNTVYSVERILKGNENYVFSSNDIVVDDEIQYGYLFIYGHSVSAEEIITDKGKMVNKLGTNRQSKLFIPHIPISFDYWESYFYVLDLRRDYPNKLSVNIDNNNYSYTNNESFIELNLEDFIFSDTPEDKSWGWADCGESNPFGAPVCDKTFLGFEVFTHNNADGASVYSEGIAHLSLFIPHIPKETNIFWTGFAVVNTDEKNSVATFHFYSEDGEFLGNQSLTIPAQSKIVGTMKDLFPDFFGKADWGYITSDAHLIGIEIYGTLKNGICGFNLPPVASLNGYFPVLMSGTDLWNGFALVNPGEEPATVKITLVKNSSGIKYSVAVILKPKNKIIDLVKDVFSNIEIESGDYVLFESDNPVIGIMVNGDLERTFMSAISALK